MNKSVKNNIIIFALMILSVLVFAACNHDSGIESNNSKNTNSSQIEISSTIDVSQSQSESTNQTDEINWENDYIMPCSIDAESVAGFEDDKLLFFSSVRLHGRPKYAPESIKLMYTEISHIHNNEEISEDIKQDMSQNYDYIATRNKIFTEDIKRITVNDYYAEDSTGYDASNDSILLRTNAEWNVIPWRVKYINYCEETINPKEIWINKMKESLDAATGGTYTPIVIWESWSFDFNGDEISFVNATNFADKISLESWDYPLNESYVYTENDIIYTASAFFCNEEMIWFQINMDYYVNDVLETNDESNDATLYLYQADDSGSIVVCPFHLMSGYDRIITKLDNWYQPDVLCVLDMNNDNYPEIVLSEFTGLLREVSSYKYKNNTITNNGILFYIGGMRGEGYPLEYFPK